MSTRLPRQALVAATAAAVLVFFPVAASAIPASATSGTPALTTSGRPAQLQGQPVIQAVQFALDPNNSITVEVMGSGFGSNTSCFVLLLRLVVLLPNPDPITSTVMLLLGSRAN